MFQLVSFMAFLRRESTETMVSHANSTSELARGLSHILNDLGGELPDSIEKLKDIPWFTSGCVYGPQL